MLKSWMRDITLAVQTRSGINAAVVVWALVIAVASLTVFVFLCVAGFEWLSLLLGPTFGGLIMAGVFLLIALLAATICALARRRIRERAILERAARAHTTSWLFDPRIVSVGLQAGRTIGWQRIVPVALLGFMVAQWAREYRGRGHGHGDPG